MNFSIIENNFLSRIKSKRRGFRVKFDVNRFMPMLMLLGILLSFGCAYAGPVWINSNTSFTSPTAYVAGNSYNFQITWTDTNTGGFANATFQLGRPNGAYTNYTNTSTIDVRNSTAAWYINFTQNQLGPAGTYNFTWYGINVSGSQNKSDTSGYAVSQGTAVLSVSPLAGVTYPATVQTGCQRVTGDPNATLTLLMNGSTVAGGASTYINQSSITLGVAVYNYTCTYAATQNYSAAVSADNDRTVGQGTPTLSVSPLATVTYPVAVQTGCERVAGDPNSTLTLDMNGTTVATGTTATINQTSISLLANNVYNYTCNISQTQNYTATVSTDNLRTVNKGILSLSISGSNVTYPDNVTINVTESNVGDADVNYTFYRNNTLLSVSTTNGTAPANESRQYGVGGYLYIFNTTAGPFANWTVNVTGVNRTIAVSPGTLSLSIAAILDVTYPDNVTVTISESNTGDKDVNYTLYRNNSGVPINVSTTNGTAPYGVIEQLTAGSYMYIFNTTAGPFANWTAYTLGDINQTVVVNPTPTATTTTVPSGGGGTGGSITPPQKKKSQTWSKITPGSAEIMHIDDPEIGLKMINITVRNPVKTVTITVTKLAGQPATVTKTVSGKVYKYMEITTTNLPDNSTDRIKIQFQVNKSWISSNKINRATVALNRYKDGVWQKLTTKEVSEDNGYIYYEAETPGFSTFVVTGEETAVTTALTRTIVTTPLATTMVTTTIPVTPIGGVIPGWVPILIVVVFVVIIATFFMYGNKQSRSKKAKINEKDIREKFTLPDFDQ